MMPAAVAETIVAGLPDQQSHAEKGIAFDGRGGLYVNVGAPSNACQQPDRQAKVPGQDPCPLLERHGGIWRFDENKAGQKQADGKLFATGLRQMIGLAWHDNALWIVMHNRDGLDTLWPGQFNAEQNAEWPAEYLVRVTEGSNFGWPYCFYSTAEKKLRHEPRVRRRRQEDRSLRRVHAAGRRVPRALGAERRSSSTPARSSRSSTRAARSSRFTDRGTARRCRRAATT